MNYWKPSGYLDLCHRSVLFWLLTLETPRGPLLIACVWLVTVKCHTEFFIANLQLWLKWKIKQRRSGVVWGHSRGSGSTTPETEMQQWHVRIDSVKKNAHVFMLRIICPIYFSVMGFNILSVTCHNLDAPMGAIKLLILLPLLHTHIQVKWPGRIWLPFNHSSVVGPPVGDTH